MCQFIWDRLFGFILKPHPYDYMNNINHNQQERVREIHNSEKAKL